MSYSYADCTVTSLTTNYKPVGSAEQLGGLTMYTVGPKNSKKVVLALYDCFGLHVNTMQFCDILAKHSGWRVVLPDFFRGDDASNHMKDMPTMFSWLKQVGTFDAISPDLDRIEKHLKKDGAEVATMVGFDWGAKIAIRATAHSSFFVGASLIQPAFIETEEANYVSAPILAIPAKDDINMAPFMKIVKNKSFGDQCEHIRFEDVYHGFCTVRGDYNNREIKKRATEAIQLTFDFLSKCFEAK